MGYYINPTDGSSKENWLEKNGKLAFVNEVNKCDYHKQNPVCLIDNGAFTAAGIGYNERETNVFLAPDGRPKKWYLVDKDKLKEFM